MKHPLVNRTSPKGPGSPFIGTCAGSPFIGTCAACGKAGVTFAMMGEECENVRQMTQEQALLEALDPPKYNARNYPL